VAFANVALRSRPRMIVGEEAAVAELWQAIRHRLPAPLDDRPGQPVYVLEELPPPGGSGLRPARLTDLELLVPACAAAYLEEVGVDAHARDPALSEWRTRAQIEAGRSWLWAEGGQIRFKAEASAWTDRAVQLQQVWVEPELRGRGYARQALADLCRLLLETTPAVCLFVRPENTRAIALYESLGMRRTITYRSLIFG
jgi:predicted GNAT family acetyltransferase